MLQSLDINVITLVRYNIVPKTCQKLHAKNLLKIPQAKIQQKSFMISLTKNPIKILNNNKKPLTSFKIINKHKNMAHLLNSNQKNIEALVLKIKDQKELLKANKNDIYLKNVIKTNQNTLQFLQTKHKKSIYEF